MKLSGIAAWAFVQSPKKEHTTKKGQIIPSVYTLDLILDVKTAKELKAKGFKVKKIEKEIKGIPDAVGKPFLQIKKPAMYEGIPTDPPEVVNGKLQPMTKLIGNGSEVNVIFAAREWEAFGQKGVSAKLRKVQVIKLVEYAGAEDLEEFEEIEGFEEEEKPKVKKKSDEFDELDDIDF